MGYLFLSLALCAGLAKAYCGKRSAYAIRHTRDAITITTVRMLICCLIGGVLPLATGASLAPCSTKMLFIALACGVCSAGFVVCWLLAVRNTMYMLVEVFVTGGVLVPLVLCNILYGEPIGIADAVGIVLLFVGIYFISTGGKTKNKAERAEKREKRGWSVAGTLLLLLAALFSGGADLAQKIYTKELPEGNALVFNFYVYVFAAIVLIVVNLALHLKTRESPRASLSVIKQIWLFVVIMAACLFLNSYFKTLAASGLDAVVLYPLNQGMAMVLSSIMAVVIFKEKIGPRSSVGIALTLAALILINVNF